MNTLERRQIVRGQVIDMVVAKTAVTKSRRERADAAKKLRKALAASRYAKLRVEPISDPRAGSAGPLKERPATCGAVARPSASSLRRAGRRREPLLSRSAAPRARSIASCR